MPNQNSYYQAPIMEVRQIDYQVPSWEEFAKNQQETKLHYEELASCGDLGATKKYGPCVYAGTNCGCNCRSSGCDCSVGKKIRSLRRDDETHYINVLNDGDANLDEHFLGFDERAIKDPHSSSHIGRVSGSVSARIGRGGIMYDAELSGSLVNVELEYGGLELLSGIALAEMGAGEGGIVAKAEATVNLIKTEIKGISTSLRVSADTGFQITPTQFELKLFGTGLKVGAVMGIDTPFIGISVDFRKLFNMNVNDNIY